MEEVTQDKTEEMNKNQVWKYVVPKKHELNSTDNEESLKKFK